MISALSQATAHAGQKTKQAAPAQQQTAQQQVSTDDPDALPAAPAQTPTLVIVKQKSFLEKALPWVAAGLVALGGAVVGPYYLGKNFHNTKVVPAMEKVAKEVKANNEYKTKFIDPRLEIHAKYQEYLNANPNATDAEKKNLGEFLKNLLISEKGHIADMYFIPLEGNEKALPIIFLQENLNVAKEALAKDGHLPKEFKDGIQGIFDILLGDFSSHTNKYPQTTSNSDFSQQIVWSKDSSGNLSHELLDRKVSNISTGWQVATNKVQGWANKLIQPWRRRSK